jgi:lysophospholipase L1-like esterase
MPDLSDSPQSRPGLFRRSAILREARSWPTLVLIVVCLFGGIPATILLTPEQPLTVAGQTLFASARTPSLSVSGPAQLVQIGNTRLDISPLQVYGPLRPRLTLGPVQRNAAAAAALDPSTRGNLGSTATDAIGSAYAHWYVFATLGLVAFVLLAAAVLAYTRVTLTLRRHSRTHAQPLTVADIWQRTAGQLRGMAVIALVVTLAAWLGAGLLAYQGAVRGLRNVSSLADLVGTQYLSPPAIGPPIRGYAGAVIGDSRASRVGGPLVPGATSEDKVCARSSDSLAAEIGNLRGERVLNLACSGASITAGLRGPQVANGQLVLPQVGRLTQVVGLKYVVVVIGPNDLYWSDFLRYCYGVANCSDNLSEGEFAYRLADFDRSYGDLLEDLNDLPDRPQIVIVTSYDVFNSGANCADTKPAGTAGLSAANINLLANRNAALNSVLTTGAAKYKFDVAQPRLAPLCAPSQDALGPDIQGLSTPNPFHPTGIGEIRLASSVVQVLKAPPPKPGG